MFEIQANISNINNAPLNLINNSFHQKDRTVCIVWSISLQITAAALKVNC